MIKHIKCDIFKSGADVICHQVNCQGAMNSGVARQVREKYPWVYGQYKCLCDTYNALDIELLGSYQRVFIDECRSIINIFGQDKFGYDGRCYTNYDMLKWCLEEIAYDLENKNIHTIAIPYKMACHRGGGDWNVVYKMIEEVFTDSSYEVLICEYDGG